MGETGQTRSTRTRNAIIHAFNLLVVQRRQRRIGVRDVVSEARVGRSTFYEHFSSAEAVHMAALSRPFAILADAAAGRGEPAATARLLAHFWENRGRAPETFGGRTGEQSRRLLRELVEERLEERLALPRRLAAQQLAGAALAPVQAWLLGEAPSTPEALAEALCRSGAVLAAALRPSG